MAHSIKRIRTIALVGQSGSGKTSLTEALLAKAGTIPAGGSVLSGTGDAADWLRAQGRSRFLFTAPPLRLPGAVGSPVTGVGTV